MADEMKNAPVLQSTLQVFDPVKYDWKIYQEKLDFYFSSQLISDDGRKRDALVNYLDTNVYKLLRDLCSPELPSKKSYVELCKILEEHFTPPINVFGERKVFFAAVKSDDETSNEFCARLKGLAVNCEFETHLEHNLVNKFVTSVNEKCFEKFCEQKKDLALKAALEIAVKNEIKTEQRTPKIEDVNFMKKTYNQRKSRSPERKSEPAIRRFNTPARTRGTRCFRCGMVNSHDSEVCNFISLKCYRCKEVGHSSRVCKNFKDNLYMESHGEESLAKEPVNPNVVSSIYNISNSKLDKPIMVDVIINGIELEMLIDTGASLSAISKKMYNELFSNFKINEDNVILQSYSGEILKVTGSINVSIKYKNLSKMLKIVVVENGGPAILGRDFLRLFKIGFSNVNNLNVNNELNILLDQYQDLFNGELGKFKYSKVHLEVKEKSSPIFFQPRKVPFAFKHKVEEELDKLIANGVLTKVDTAEYGTPLVPILKEDGHIRICGDYKVTINKNLKDFNYPLPRIQDIFDKLRGGKTYSKLDLNCAYNQLELDDESKKLVSWSTHKGVFQMNRLPFGVKPASGIFQSTIEKLLLGIPGVVNFIDDIVVTGKDQEEHLANLKLVFERLFDAGLRLNKRKCEFFKENIKYLGFELSGQGLSKTDERIKAILDAKIPTNVSEVKSFCGLVNHYSMFIKNCADILHPLFNLQKKSVKFEWTDDCQRAVDAIKKDIVSNVVLVHFDSKLPIILTCDASNKGLGCVLSHRYPDGLIKPIAFGSRTLTSAEDNYSILDKELLAIIFGVKKFFQYLIGIHFILQTDHKPLLKLFGENQGLPQMAASRLQRWAHTLSGFNYSIQYIKSKDNQADMLSRLPMNVGDNLNESANYLNFIGKGSDLPLNHNHIRNGTKTDTVLCRVLDAVKFGNLDKLTGSQYDSFRRKGSELTVEQEILMWGYRVVVPEKLRPQILNELHSSHFGVVKSKSIARSYVWWPGIDEDIANMIKNCRSCISVLPNPVKSELIPWKCPGKPWSRIHIDFAGPFLNYYFLVVVDAYSKWIEVIKLSSTTAKVTECKLRELFSRFGLPDILVSDNGSQLVSHELESFLNRNGIKHKLTSPGHPATNGAAENLVKTVKSSLLASLHFMKSKSEIFDLDLSLCRFLFDYRSTKHCTTNETPARLMFNREIKTLFNLLKPPTQEQIVDKAQERQISNYKGKRSIKFSVGEKVVVKDYSDPNKSAWVDAVIFKVIGPRTYICKLLSSGRNIKRHLNQIRINVNENANENNSIDLNSNEIKKKVCLEIQPTIVMNKINHPIGCENIVRSANDDVNINVFPLPQIENELDIINEETFDLNDRLVDPVINDNSCRPKRTIVKPIRFRDGAE